MTDTTELSNARAEIERLRGELVHLYTGYVSTLEAGRDRILSLGGECDPVVVMERNDPYLIQARRAIDRDAKNKGERNGN